MSGRPSDNTTVARCGLCATDGSPSRRRGGITTRLLPLARAVVLGLAEIVALTLFAACVIVGAIALN